MNQLSQLSVSDLYELCLRYADAESIFTLKHTCKDMIRKIPESWCKERIVIQEYEKYEEDYRFLFRIYGFQINLKSIEFNYRHFRSIHEITLVQVDKLTKLVFDPRMTQIQSIFINHAKSLKSIEIPHSYQHLKMLYISYTNIRHITIHPTWTKLETLVLIDAQISVLSIPKTCERINYINISKSTIKNIYFYPHLNHSLFIQTTGFETSTIFYTDPSNQNYIASSGVIVIKTFQS